MAERKRKKKRDSIPSLDIDSPTGWSKVSPELQAAFDAAEARIELMECPACGELMKLVQENGKKRFRCVSPTCQDFSLCIDGERLRIMKDPDPCENCATVDMAQKVVWCRLLLFDMLEGIRVAIREHRIR